MITTEAWVIHQGAEVRGARGREPAELRREIYSFPDITEREVLAEPLYGCWEGNMTHALMREPVDVCRQRGEEKVVIGNAGVVRVLKAGGAVAALREGDLCLIFCNGISDELGYPEKIFAYDAPATVGVLAKRLKLHEEQLIPIPRGTKFSLPQWAAFSLRYITAWANWKVAYGCWRLHYPAEGGAGPSVWGWGGGVTLAELTLAKLRGCRCAMISSCDERLKLIGGAGILPIDRRPFSGLNFDPVKYRSDPAYKKTYAAAEELFLDVVKEKTCGSGVSIFIDFIGLPVFRATLKALSRPGVITTAGWKQGMHLSTIRAVECMSWHTHVHTHYARYPEGVEAVRFAEEAGWLPRAGDEVYGWDRIPELAREHAAGKVATYFPIFQVNPL